MLSPLGFLSAFLTISTPSSVQDISDFTMQEEAVATYGDMVREMEKPLIEQSLHKKHCSASQVAQEQKAAEPSPLMIFVSFSMSDQDLQSLYHEVQIVGGRLVMRGLHQNSWKVMAQKIQVLKIAVDIDPDAFDRYHITSVPQFVLQGVYDTRVSDTFYVVKWDRVNTLAFRGTLQYYVGYGIQARFT